MPSNDELMMRAEYVATHSVFELPEGDSDHGLVCYGESAEILARHVKSTLATEQAGEQAIDEAWLREIGFVSVEGKCPTLTIQPRSYHLNVLLWIDVEEGRLFIGQNGNMQDDCVVVTTMKYTTRRQLLALLTALGIDTTTSNREGK